MPIKITNNTGSPEIEESAQVLFGWTDFRLPAHNGYKRDEIKFSVPEALYPNPTIEKGWKISGALTKTGRGFKERKWF